MAAFLNYNGIYMSSGSGKSPHIQANGSQNYSRVKVAVLQPLEYAREYKDVSGVYPFEGEVCDHYESLQESLNWLQENFSYEPESNMDESEPSSISSGPPTFCYSSRKGTDSVFEDTDGTNWSSEQQSSKFLTGIDCAEPAAGFGGLQHLETMQDSIDVADEALVEPIIKSTSLQAFHNVLHRNESMPLRVDSSSDQNSVASPDLAAVISSLDRHIRTSSKGATDLALSPEVDPEASCDESLDTVSFLEYDSDPFKELDPQQLTVINSCLQEISTELVRLFWTERAACQADTPCDTETSSQQSSTGTGNSSTLGSGTGSKSSVSNGKRRKIVRSGENDSDDDGGENPQERKRARKKQTVVDFINLLACPYCKFDRKRYSEQNLNVDEKDYRGCAKAIIRDINRLRQHLGRIHGKPAHYCARCFVDFSSRESLEIHLRGPQCELREGRYLERMNYDQAQRIHNEVRDKNVTVAWKAIYQILFPYAPIPASIHPDAEIMPMEIVQHFMQFLLERAPTIIAPHLERSVLGSNLWGQHEIFERVAEESFQLLAGTMPALYQQEKLTQRR